MIAFIADSADIYGNVTLGEDTTVWFQTVLRADDNTIHIGDRTNIQDGTVIHVDPDAPVVIGNEVTIGHNCVIHGCEIQDGALIGMGSIILNGAVVGENALIGAGSLVTKGMIIPPNTMAFGHPAKIVRKLTTDEIHNTKIGVQNYIDKGKKFASGHYTSIYS